ncbi:hypothetical protein ZTR_03424 [Talaromyces verruculosus]|nr:hypothetical protein ZTR_03424 [Talaromyces verruculosus]
MTATNTIINPTCLAPAGPFSHGIVVPAGQEIVYTAGQIGTIDAKGTIARTYEDQVIAAIRNLHVVLKEAGGTPKDIVKLTYYIVDYDVCNRMIHINALQKFLDGHKPVTTLVGVTKLANPALKFEIEAVAVIKPRSRF